MFRSTRILLRYILILAGLGILYFVARANYLLFHVLVELFSVIIAFALFTFTWQARRMLDNKYLLLVGIAAFFIGFLDLMHTLTYPGMDLIKGEFMSNQFWVATRFLESTTLLAGFIFVTRPWKIHPETISFVYLILTILIIISIVFWKVFPVCYIEGEGQTKFKIISEYVIIGILLLALLFLFRNRNYFYPYVFKLLVISIVATIISEFFFTLYFSNYGVFNQIGHYFKLLSFYMIYKANIETGFIKPTEVIYRELKNSREEINKYNTKLEAEISTRDKLFSIIAHDLRSPFTAILGYSELLVDELKKYALPVALNSAIKIQHAGNQTLMLLENLLQWTQLKKGSVNPVIVKSDISRIINEVVDLYEELSVSKNILLTTELTPGLNVRSDKHMVMTILRNLLSNAIKFTYSGGVITVKSFQENEHIVIQVKDNGKGMDAEFRSRIFSGGNNVITTGTSNEKGTGLGLVICKEFAELNKGSVSVDSEPGKGSTFSLTLPAYV